MVHNETLFRYLKHQHILKRLGNRQKKAFKTSLVHYIICQASVLPRYRGSCYILLLKKKSISFVFNKKDLILTIVPGGKLLHTYILVHPYFQTDTYSQQIYTDILPYIRPCCKCIVIITRGGRPR